MRFGSRYGLMRQLWVSAKAPDQLAKFQYDLDFVDVPLTEY